MLPPGPREPAALQTVEWVARPTAFLRRSRARHGDPFTIRVAWADAPMVLVSEPEDVKRVFTARDGALLGGSSSTVLEPFAGPSSILLLDGPEHLRQRRLMLPPFHGDALQASRATIAELARAEIATWTPGAPVRTLRRMQALTLDVILRVVFGPGERRELREAIRRALDMTASLPRLVAMSLTPHDRGPWRAFRAAVADVDALLRRELAGPAADGSIVAMRESAGPDELRDQVVTLLAAGHETTAGSLAWGLERLAHHPQVLDRIRGGDEASLDATVKEVLRVRPVLSIAARKTAAPFAVGGFTLPAGVHVAPCISLAHRRPQAWPDPTAFRPERFLDGAPEPYTYLPFGGGVRRCVGAAFAALEMKEVLRAVAERMRLHAPRPRGERMRRASVTITPAHGALVVPEPLQPVQPRCPSSAATTA